MSSLSGVASAYVPAGQGYPGPVAAPRSANPSCFNGIEGATSRCYETAIRVRAVVDRLCGAGDRLCGAVPEGDNSAGSLIGGNGLFDAAQRQANEISDSMARISDALDRLEGMLP